MDRNTGNAVVRGGSVKPHDNLAQDQVPLLEKEGLITPPVRHAAFDIHPQDHAVGQPLHGGGADECDHDSDDRYEYDDRANGGKESHKNSP